MTGCKFGSKLNN